LGSVVSLAGRGLTGAPGTRGWRLIRGEWDLFLELLAGVLAGGHLLLDRLARALVGAHLLQRLLLLLLDGGLCVQSPVEGAAVRGPAGPDRVEREVVLP